MTEFIKSCYWHQALESPNVQLYCKSIQFVIMMSFLVCAPLQISLNGSFTWLPQTQNSVLNDYPVLHVNNTVKQRMLYVATNVKNKVEKENHALGNSQVLQ